MIGKKKLSTIRGELRSALRKSGSNAVAAIDSKIRESQKQSKVTDKHSRSLELLRGALAQLVENQPRKSRRSPRAKLTKKVNVGTTR